MEEREGGEGGGEGGSVGGWRVEWMRRRVGEWMVGEWMVGEWMVGECSGGGGGWESVVEKGGFPAPFQTLTAPKPIPCKPSPFPAPLQAFTRPTHPSSEGWVGRGEGLEGIGWTG